MDSDQPSRLLRSFERYLRAGNRSERTVGNYLKGLGCRVELKCLAGA